MHVTFEVKEVASCRPESLIQSPEGFSAQGSGFRVRKELRV